MNYYYLSLILLFSLLCGPLDALRPLVIVPGSIHSKLFVSSRGGPRTLLCPNSSWFATPEVLIIVFVIAVCIFE